MDLIFDKKRKYKDEEDIDIIDLSDAVVNYDEITANTVIALTDQHVARIDRVAYDHVSQSDNSIDTLMYINGIHNPFSLYEGETLYIPNHSDTLYTSNEDVVFPDKQDSDTDDVQKTEAQTFKDKLAQATDLLKAKPDEKRKERLERLASARKNGAKPIAPNMLQDGETAKIAQNGAIILGTNINTK